MASMMAAAKLIGFRLLGQGIACRPWPGLTEVVAGFVATESLLVVLGVEKVLSWCSSRGQVEGGGG